MDRELRHGKDVVEAFIFLQVADMLCHQHGEDDLDDLARLDADAEEADPAFVAGAVVNAEGDEREQKHERNARQNWPFVRNDVQIEHGQHDVERNADQNGDGLDENIVGAALLARCGGA